MLPYTEIVSYFKSKERFLTSRTALLLIPHHTHFHLNRAQIHRWGPSWKSARATIPWPREICMNIILKWVRTFFSATECNFLYHLYIRYLLCYARMRCCMLMKYGVLATNIWSRIWRWYFVLATQCRTTLVYSSGIILNPTRLKYVNHSGSFQWKKRLSD